MIPTLSSSRMQVERFNAACDVGAEVVYRSGLGRMVCTRTASKAHMAGTDAVVFVLGIAGRVPLNRVSPQ